MICGAMRFIFQFTPLREGRLYLNSQFMHQAISIHAPPRGATSSCLVSSAEVSYFNSRPSARGDMRRVSPLAASVFQFTPLREGRRRCRRSVCRTTYFNSRPSARGDPAVSTTELCEKISIHAPPRGATRVRRPPAYSHTFQFTPLREGRRRKARERIIDGEISIHAPPRGATLLGSLKGGNEKIFQFTPLREGRRRPLKGV